VSFPSRPPLSCEITDCLFEDYQAFFTRDLSEVAVEYLFLDAIFESLRAQGVKEALLVAWGIDKEGRKHLAHLAVENQGVRGVAGLSACATWSPGACGPPPRSRPTVRQG